MGFPVNVVSEAGRIGQDIAGPSADAVDRDARFPSETMDALGASGLLGAFVPAEWGGPGATLPEAAQAVSAVSRHSASSGLIFAMHLIQVAYLDRHGSDTAKNVLFPRLLAGDLLLGSANSEVGLDGARRTSICALEPIDGGYRLEKQASTVSYGEYSGAILATAAADHPTAHRTNKCSWSATNPAWSSPRREPGTLWVCAERAAVPGCSARTYYPNSCSAISPRSSH